MPPDLHIFGIRHHGPGSARSLLRALAEVELDCVLIEGPPDADEMMSWAAKPEMKPPVAILIHESSNPKRAAYYPFAEFSPEWVAMRWAIAAGVPVRFMDLPQAHAMGLEAEREKKFAEAVEAAKQEAEKDEDRQQIDAVAPALAPAAAPKNLDEPLRDPLGALAHAAGFEDGERWWEHVVEHRFEGGVDVFNAVREAMAELRQAHPTPRDEDEPVREAWMRRTIRDARKQFKSIAVICGAWHAPVLDVDAVPKKQDDDLLKGLPKVKTTATWVPWTYEHLTFWSGYGAGVQSPGWYEHLWRQQGSIIESWMTRVAHLLREQDLDCSSAHVIEAVRLSRTLATLRGRPLADLSDIADATRSVFFHDGDGPMRLISRKLLVGERIGEVPDDVPMVPLQQDLMRLQKSLRMKPEALEKTLDLDLRGDTDRQRSRLLHRLRLLGIDWGTLQDNGGGKGTFHEIWSLRWEPIFAVRLIEAGPLGATIESAAAGKLRKLAAESTELRALTELLADALLAELGDAVAALVRQIENVAALSADVTLLMGALPQLARALRYGSVRQTDAGLVRHMIDGIVPRITAGLGGAVSSLNDDAAEAIDAQIRRTSGAIDLIEAAEHKTAWLDCLAAVAASDSIHGLVRGTAARLLLDAARIDNAQVARHMALALSRGADPWQAAQWAEGFLRGSGLLLIHDPKLLGVIDAWVTAIAPDAFEQVVPLLRRTFTTFPKPERREIGKMLAKGETAERTVTSAGDEEVDRERAEAALPLLMQILGSD